jgi:hypothetical protein
MVDSFVERRRHPRSEMFLVMEIEDSSKTSGKLNVITKNISAGGVYFETSHADELEVGTDMGFTIFLSVPTTKGKSHTSKMAGNGKIVREDSLSNGSIKEDGGHWKGIALEFDRPLKML